MAYEIRQTHIDKALTNLSSKLTNEELVADRLVQSISVANQTDVFYRHQNEDFIGADDIRAPGSKIKEIPGLHLGVENFHCQEYAVQGRVTDEERANSTSPIMPDQDMTMVLTNHLMLAREKRIVDIVTDADRYPSDLKSTPSDLWDTAAAKIIADVENAKQAIHKRIYKEPNVMVIPREVYVKMKQNTDIIDRIKYTQTGVTDAQLFSSLFGLEVLIPGSGIIAKGTSAGGDSVAQNYDGSNTKTGALATSATTSGFNYLWPNHVVIAHVPPLPSLKTTGFLMELVWNGPYNSMNNTNVFRIRDAETRSDMIQVSRYYDFKLLTIDETQDRSANPPPKRVTLAGYLFQNVVS